MKACKTLFLLGLFFAFTNSIGEMFTTSHVENVNQRQRGKNIRPKQHFCSDGPIQKVKCKTQSSNACESGNFPTQAPVCAFDKVGVKFDFKRQCQACEHESINYYFRSTCDKIPKICTKTQECVNGVCVALLNSLEDANRIVCNSQADCPSKTDLCVANKCVDKKDLIKKLQKAEKTNPQLAEKNDRVRKEAMRFELQRRMKDFEGIKKLKDEIETSKNKNKGKPKPRRTPPLPNPRGLFGSN